MTRANVLEPADIFTEIDSRPPLMRDEACKIYVGKEVEWLLAFANGYEFGEKGRVRLSFRCEPRLLGWVVGTVALSDYPWLKSLQADEIVRVRGRISGIDAMTITLDKLELSLFETAKA